MTKLLLRVQLRRFKNALKCFGRIKMLSSEVRHCVVSKRTLGPDVRQRGAAGDGLDLPLAPEHDRRQQDADAPDQQPAQSA